MLIIRPIARLATVLSAPSLQPPPKAPHTVYKHGHCFVRRSETRVRVCPPPKAPHTVYKHGHCFVRRSETRVRVCLLVACLTSQQQASVSQGRICLDNLTCCHTEIQVADQTFNLTQSQYTDTGPTSPSADPITPGAWQGNHWSANFLKSLV